MNIDQFISKFDFRDNEAEKIRVNWDSILAISNFINNLVPKSGWFPNPKKRSDYFVNYCGLVEHKYLDNFSSKAEFLNAAIYAILLAETKNSDLNYDKVAFLNLYQRGNYSFGDLSMLAYQIGELVKNDGK